MSIQKMVKNQDKIAIKSGIWYTISNFILKSLNFLMVPILVRILSKEQYGDYSNYLSWFTILTIVLTLNLDSSLISAKSDFSTKLESYIYSMIVLSSISIVLGMTIVIALNMSILSSWINLDTKYLFYLLFYILFQNVINIYQSKLLFFWEYKKNTLISVTLAIGVTILSITLSMVLKNKTDGPILGSLIPTFVMGLVLYAIYICRVKKVEIAYWKYAIPICIPYIPHLLSIILLNCCDRIMIKRYCGSGATALYSLAYSCGTVITFLWLAMNKAYSPWLASQLEDKNYKKIRLYSKYYVLLFGYGIVYLMLISPEILLIIGGEKYREVVGIMAPITLACLYQFMYTMFVNVEQYKKKTIDMAVASCAAAIINIVMNFIFIPRYGYVAAAYTTLLGYLALLVFHMIIVVKIKMAVVYDYLFIILVMVLGVIFMMLSLFVYDYTFIRYCVVILYTMLGIGILFRNRKELRKIVGDNN